MSPCRGDGSQHRLRGAQARTLDGFGVEVRVIEVVELLPVAARGAVLGERVEDVAQLLQRALAQQGKTAPGGAVRWNLCGVEPATVGMAREVIAGLHARISAGEIETKGADLRMVGGASRGRRAATHGGEGKRKCATTEQGQGEGAI